MRSARSAAARAARVDRESRERRVALLDVRLHFSAFLGLGSLSEGFLYMV